MRDTPMTLREEKSILESPCTRKLVKEVLGLAETRDICDAIADLELALEILHGRFADARLDADWPTDNLDAEKEA